MIELMIDQEAEWDHEYFASFENYIKGLDLIFPLDLDTFMKLEMKYYQKYKKKSGLQKKFSRALKEINNRKYNKKRGYSFW